MTSQISSAALDEFEELMRDKTTENRHPEDIELDAEEKISVKSTTDDYREIIDPEDDMVGTRNVSSGTTRAVKTRYSSYRPIANTGVKGVICDKMDYDDELEAAGIARHNPVKLLSHSEHEDKENIYELDSKDRDFFKSWRERRMMELKQSVGKPRSRDTSPVLKTWGTFSDVSKWKYDTACETSNAKTVIAFLYDENDEDGPTDELADGVEELARRHTTSLFFKYKNEYAEIDPECLPAILAFEKGERICTLLPLVKYLPKNRYDAQSIEGVLRQNKVL